MVDSCGAGMGCCFYGRSKRIRAMPHPKIPIVRLLICWCDNFIVEICIQAVLEVVLLPEAPLPAVPPEVLQSQPLLLSPQVAKHKS